MMGWSLLVAQVGVRVVLAPMWLLVGVRTLCVLVSGVSLNAPRLDLTRKSMNLPRSADCLLSESQDLRLEHVLLALATRALIELLLGHLELILSNLEMVGGLEQVPNVSIVCHAAEVDVGEATEVSNEFRDQLCVALLARQLSLDRGVEQVVRCSCPLPL